MNAASILCNARKPSAAQVAQIDLKTITPDVMLQSILEVTPLYDDLGANDQVAKGKELLQCLQELLAVKYPAESRQ